MNNNLAKYDISQSDLTPRGHEPLSVKIEEGALTISIGIGVLAYAVQMNENSWESGWRIADIPVFAKEVLRELERDDETGATRVHRLLEDAAEEVLEQGGDGIEDFRPVDPADCVDAYDHREQMHTDVADFGLEAAVAYNTACEHIAPPKPGPFDKYGNIRVYAITRSPLLKAKIYDFLEANSGVVGGGKTYDDLYEEICDIFLPPEKKN